MPEIKRDMLIIPELDREYAQLPHTSPSGIDAFTSCRRNAFYHYIAQIILKSGKLSLTLGTIWHEILAAFYNSGKKKTGIRAISKEVHKSVATGFSPFRTPTDIAVNMAMMKGMFLGYHAHFGKTDYKNWEIVGVEVPFLKRNWMGTGIDLVGIIDLIIRIKTGLSKGLWVVEHKSTTNLKYHTAEVVRHKVQTMAYVHAGRKILGHKIRGIIWNAIAKPGKRLKRNQTVEEYCQELKEDYPARPDFYFLRHQFLITKKKVDEWETDMLMILNDLALCHEYPSDRAHWYKNRAQCDMYGGCDFAPLCYRGEKRSTIRLYKRIKR